MAAQRQIMRAPSVRQSEEIAANARFEALGSARLRAQVFELVCRHMRTLVGAHDPDYEDLVQAAAERAVRDLDGFAGSSRLSTWVYRVCYTTLLTQRRWYRRWLKRFTLSASGNLPEEALPQAAGCERSLDERARAQRLHAAIAKLSEKRRTVVVLHDLQGLDVNEIAEIVKANVLTVRSRLRDGRRDLAARLRRDPFFGDEVCRSGGRDDS